MSKRAKANTDRRLNGYYTAPLKDLLLNSTYQVKFHYEKHLDKSDDIYDDKVQIEFKDRIQEMDLSKLPNGRYYFHFSRHQLGAYYGSITDSVTIDVNEGNVTYSKE